MTVMRNSGPPIRPKSFQVYPAGRICMFTAVPIGVAIARFVPIARTTHHGTGLIPIVSAMEITIGDIRAATVLFCRNRVRTLESTQITTVKTTTDAFAPPNILGLCRR